MSVTVVVTGGAGFIGSHIAQRLVEQGFQVRVVDNLCTGRRENLASIWKQIEFFEVDIRSPEPLARAMEGAEFVFHQAALASVPLSLEKPELVNDVCVAGTLNVLEQARRAKVQRVIYAGSSSCYGNTPFAAKRESDELMTLSPYAAAKLAGERYCQAYFHSFGLETVCLRYFNVFGPRQDPNGHYSAVIPKFITRMLSGSAIDVFGDGEQSRDFCYVQNIVEANWLAMMTSGIAGETFNVSTGESTSLMTLIQTLERNLGIKAKVNFQPSREGDVRHSLADISRASAGLNYSPGISFSEGIRMSIDYYRATLMKPADGNKEIRTISNSKK